MIDKRIAEKIAKCMALAGSDNPAEAEVAMRQARKLMKKYGLTDMDVAASSVKEETRNTGGKYRPPLYVCELASIVAAAFGCSPIFHHGGGWHPSEVKFIGVGAKPELAAYTFEVLLRQLKRHRREYLATQKRVKRATKIRRGNIFCEAWLSRVVRQVHEFAGTEDEKQAIAAYKERTYTDLQTERRDLTRAQNTGDHLGALEGHTAADGVSLHRPVQTSRNGFLGSQTDQA